MAALALIGGLIGAAGSVIGGISANNQAQAQASALKVQAGEERASSQREAITRTRQANLIMSRQQTVAAASGGGAGDPSVVNLMAGVGAQGQYEAGSAMYEGETKARGDEHQADITKMQGKQALFAGFINGAGSMINGFSTFSRYSGGMPTSFGSAAAPATASSYYNPYGASGSTIPSVSNPAPIAPLAPMFGYGAGGGYGGGYVTQYPSSDLWNAPNRGMR